MCESSEVGKELLRMKNEAGRSITILAVGAAILGLLGVWLVISILAVPGRATPPAVPGSASEQDDPEFRTWTDSSGRHRTEAKMIKYADGKVYLKKTDGTVVAILVSRLSTGDQQYVKEEFARRTALQEERQTGLPGTATHAPDWPQFRGPGGFGVS